MHNHAPDIPELLATGRYWEAFGLTKPVSVVAIAARVFGLSKRVKADVTTRLVDLRDLHRGLESEIGRAHTILTQHGKAYAVACSVRDRFCREVTRAFGPALLSGSVLGDSSEGSLLARLWRTFERALLEESSERSALKQVFRDLAKEFFTEIETLARNLPAIEVSAEEVRKGIAPKSLCNKNCTECGGTGVVKVKLSELEHISKPEYFWETGYVLELMRKHPQVRKGFQDYLAHLPNPFAVNAIVHINDPAFEPGSWRPFDTKEAWKEYVQSLRLHLKITNAGDQIVEPCPKCHEEVHFELPSNLRPGWIVRAHGDRSHVARVGAVSRWDLSRMWRKFRAGAKAAARIGRLILKVAVRAGLVIWLFMASGAEKILPVVLLSLLLISDLARWALARARERALLSKFLGKRRDD